MKVRASKRLLGVHKQKVDLRHLVDRQQKAGQLMPAWHGNQLKTLCMNMALPVLLHTQKIRDEKTLTTRMATKTLILGCKKKKMTMLAFLLLEISLAL
jgi:hypothetical protein